ncbi:MAG: AMP-binding protein [Gemmatimonadaceae bacterium]
MDLLTLRAAAGGGTLDGQPAGALVAAGFTLLQRSAPVVRALAGRRAAVLVPASPQFLVALAASDGRGAVLINPLAAPAEVAAQLRDANVGAVFTVRALANRLPAGTMHVLLDDAPTTATVVAADGTTNTVDLGSHFGLSLEGDADSPGRDEECAIVYTSAMEGTPLGAVLTHRNLMANARQAVEAAHNSVDDHVLALLPFAHLFGLTVSAMAPLFVGARVTTMARFNPLVAVDLLESEEVTELVGVPAVFAGLLAAIERRGGRLRAPALRLCVCGGAPLPLALQERWAAATGVELRQGYGLTEASPVALFNRVDRANARGTLGWPFPGVQVTIREPETNRECPVGVLGEICIAGDTVFRGYVRNGGAGLRVLDGWLHSGDLGRQRDDGSIEFHGLRKVMFTRNGFNVYPREVERVLAAMPGVRSVQCTGVPDAMSEHEVAVAVNVTNGATVSAADVKAFAEQHLAAYKRPSTITFATA